MGRPRRRPYHPAPDRPDASWGIYGRPRRGDRRHRRPRRRPSGRAARPAELGHPAQLLPLTVELRARPSSHLDVGEVGSATRAAGFAVVRKVGHDCQGIGIEDDLAVLVMDRNNRIENLAWRARSAAQRSERTLSGSPPPFRRGEGHHNALLTAAYIPEIRPRSTGPASDTRRLRPDLGVDTETIRQVLLGKTWSHVPDPKGPIVMRRKGARLRRSWRRPGSTGKQLRQSEPAARPAGPTATWRTSTGAQRARSATSEIDPHLAMTARRPGRLKPPAGDDADPPTTRRTSENPYTTGRGAASAACPGATRRGSAAACRRCGIAPIARARASARGGAAAAGFVPAAR